MDGIAGCCFAACTVYCLTIALSLAVCKCMPACAVDCSVDPIANCVLDCAHCIVECIAECGAQCLAESVVGRGVYGIVYCVVARRVGCFAHGTVEWLWAKSRPRHRTPTPKTNTDVGPKCHQMCARATFGDILVCIWCAFGVGFGVRRPTAPAPL